MSWIDRHEISKYLGCLPIEIDSQDLTPSRRRRLYWTNIPFPKSLPKVRENLSTSFQSVLENATAFQAKTPCVLSSNSSGGKRQPLRVLDDDEENLRRITINELEKIMGFAAGYTNFQESPKSRKAWSPESSGKSTKSMKTGKSTKCCDTIGSPLTEEKDEKYKIRWRLLGNTFSVKVVAYLLSSLLNRSLRIKNVEQIVPFESISEHECCVMEEGDIWALYNTYEQPNWYALIIKRSGGRFSKTGNTGEKQYIQIEVKFLELAYDYTPRETDLWSPDRGTGMFNIWHDSEIQDSWCSFSHRVKSYYKFPCSYFIYPGKDEVWAVYTRQKIRSSTFFVYVAESSMSTKKLETVKPGKEGFKARCYILQQTTQPEIFRVTEKILLYEDLSCFAFSVPYYYKDESGLIKIDYSINSRKSIAHMTSTYQT